MSSIRISVRDVVNTCVDMGLFANMEDVLAYSDGNASGMFADGATSLHQGHEYPPDGNWYTCHTAASAYTNITPGPRRCGFRVRFPGRLLL
jgi:hypothetical protein